jgi:hypothetical protein
MSSSPQDLTLSNVPQTLTLGNVPQNLTLSNVPQTLTLNNVPQQPQGGLSAVETSKTPTAEQAAQHSIIMKSPNVGGFTWDAQTGQFDYTIVPTPMPQYANPQTVAPESYMPMPQYEMPVMPTPMPQYDMPVMPQGRGISVVPQPSTPMGDVTPMPQYDMPVMPTPMPQYNMPTPAAPKFMDDRITNWNPVTAPLPNDTIEALLRDRLRSWEPAPAKNKLPNLTPNNEPQTLTLSNVPQQLTLPQTFPSGRGPIGMALGGLMNKYY